MADDTHSLVMPFITCASNGGPHDDDAYIAGFEMGYLDASLSSAKALGVLVAESMIHAVNRAQADLIAMKHGYSTRFTAVEDTTEWLHVTLAYAM